MTLLLGYVTPATLSSTSFLQMLGATHVYPLQQLEHTAVERVYTCMKMKSTLVQESWIANSINAMS